ncbi:MAG: outer membrane lipoprotein-sorting protein, partial [Pseudomonadales bacterium]|nr:outer membrane lipoprotein-sorting protein [Pseudomonadales bacterium]
KLDELFRSKASKGRMTMTVVTPDFERTLGMNMVTRGMEDTLIRITSPRKEAGISTLKKGTEMWNYLPKVKKTVRVPPSMMMGAWMGSDFTNDDLVRASSWENDYDMAFVDGVGAGDEVCLRYTPKPSAAVTWDHIDTCFDGGTSLPHRQDFYDEKGRKARTLHFSEVKEMGGRTIPSVMTLEPLLKQGH